MLSIITEIFTLQNLLMMNVGLFVGIIIGAMPGLNVALAVTVLLFIAPFSSKQRGEKDGMN